MDGEIAKGRPLTKEETKSLLDLVEGSQIITTKTTNATNNKMKNVEWISLAERFNATATNCPRTPQQLRLKWENLKKNSRKRSTKIRMNQIKTGGGPAEYIPPDDILDRVTGLLGSTVSGFAVPFGGDKDQIRPYEYHQNIGCSSGDGDGLGDARVSPETQDVVYEFEPMLSTNIESVTCDNSNGGGLVTNCQVLNTVDMNVTTPNKRKFTFSTPRVNKKLKHDENKTTRNKAIAEYFATKKQCLSGKLENTKLENENLKLKNIELELRNKKLVLETEMLKLELEKLKKQ